MLFRSRHHVLFPCKLQCKNTQIDSLTFPALFSQPPRVKTYKSHQMIYSLESFVLNGLTWIVMVVIDRLLSGTRNKARRMSDMELVRVSYFREY